MGQVGSGSLQGGLIKHIQCPLTQANSPLEQGGAGYLQGAHFQYPLEQVK